jgi:hypothetical protein
MKTSIYTSLLALVITANSNAALYTSTFDAFPAPPAELAGNDGWVINDPGNPLYGTLSYLGSLNGSQALGIGGAYGETTTASVALSQSFVESVGRVSAKFDFAFEDSDESLIPARDAFSFSFNSSGSKLFEVSFVPVAQSATPSSTLAQWDLFYSVNGGASQDLFIRVDEAALYNFDLTLGGAFPSTNTSTTSFKLSISSGLNPVLTREDSFAFNPQTSLTDFSFNYTPTGGIATGGTNSLLADNLTVVPEPSSSLLLALTGLGLAARRRRA